MKKGNRLKLCFIGGSTSIHVKRWMGYFVKNGHRVSLISFSPTTISGVEVFSLNAHYFCFLPPAIRRILKWRYIPKIRYLLHHKIKPNILHGHYISEYGFFAATSGFHPLVLTSWGSDVLVDPHNSKIAKWQVKQALKRTDLITAESNYVKEATVSLGADPSIIKIIQWGVDSEEVKTISPSLPDGLAINPKHPIIISPRGFRDIFRINIIIQSIPKVIAKYPHAQFILLGNPINSKPYQKLIQKLNIEKNVKILPWLEHKILLALLKKTQILISIPSSDSASIALMEGMTCGAIPIASDLPSNREWITSGENGFIITPLNSGVLARSILKGLELTPKERKKIQIKNYKIIKEKADYQKNMAKMESLYYKLIVY